MPVLLQIVIAAFAGGILSLGIAALAAFRVRARWISTLVSYAVGALLAAVFIDILPHVFETTKHPSRTAGFILVGILAFFILEKLLIWRHHHHGGEDAQHGHDAELGDHGRSGWMIMAGDTFHNFTDGVIIASAFLADTRLGVVTSIAIIAHEIPQEVGDYIVLLNAGFSRGRALLFNALSGLAAVVGGVIGYFVVGPWQEFFP